MRRAPAGWRPAPHHQRPPAAAARSSVLPARGAAADEDPDQPAGQQAATLTVATDPADDTQVPGRTVREQAVRLVCEAGLSISQVAAEMAVPVSAVRDWVHEEGRMQAAGARLAASERDELERLRRENTALDARVRELERTLAEAVTGSACPCARRERHTAQILP